MTEKQPLLDIKHRVYDPSFLSDFARDRFHCYCRYVKGYQPKVKTHPAPFGTCIHKALALHYSEQAPIDKVIDTFKECYALKGLERNELYSMQRGENMLNGYIEKYPISKEPFKVNKDNVEVVFSLSMPDDRGGWILTGRLDMIIDWDEHRYVLDHKTTKNPNTNYFQGFRANLQMSCYTLAVKLLTGKCNGAVINALRTTPPPIKVTDRTPEQYIRWISARTDYELTRTMKELTDIVHDFEDCLQTNRWYKGSSYFVDEYNDLYIWGENERLIKQQFNVVDKGIRYDET